MGPELITNGNFNGGITPWEINSGWTYATNNIYFTGEGGDGTTEKFIQQIPIIDGEYYVVSFSVNSDASTDGGIRVRLGSNGRNAVFDPKTNGTVTAYLKAELADPTDNFIEIWARNEHVDTYVDNVSVKHISLANLTLSGELMTNGTFTGSASSWTLGSGWAYNDNNVIHTSGTAALSQIAGGTSSSSQYLITAKMDGSVGNLGVDVDDSLVHQIFNASTSVNRPIEIVQVLFDFHVNGTVYFRPSSTFNGTIDDISVREILGIGGSLPNYNPSIITAVKSVQQNVPFPQFVMAGRGGASGSTYKLFKKGTTYDFSIWRSPVYKIGQDFDVMGIEFPIIGGVTSNKEIIPVLRFDDERESSTGDIINTTNYPNSEKLIRLTSKNFENTVHGKSNFYLELQSIGTALAVVGLPINIDIETHDN